MNRIAFDLDGVFIPDCDIIPNLGGLVQFYQITVFMRPIFVPNGAYDIITARDLKYKDITTTWLKKYFSNNLPNNLYHDCTVESPSEYKTRILNQTPNIQTYIESDESIVNDLKSTVTTGCNIVLFKDYLAKGLKYEK
jgi:hypothetical protein